MTPRAEVPMTAVEADELWAGIDDQRVRTTRLLDGLSAQQWDHASLCEAWTVRHVAAHLTMQQQSFGDLVGFVARHPRMWRSVTLNATIRDSAVIRARELSTAQITDAVRAMIGSRRHNAFVTPLETLTDILVHSQDIAAPLGLQLEMRPGPCALAATRRWDMRGTWMAWVNRRLPLDGYLFRATDVHWERGQGALVEGPVGAILLLLTGRPAGLARLSGQGADSLRAQLESRGSPSGR
ncbi:MAG: maleylpyruvate isomerase family mycothiol-dependent enzyme [Ornithinibacter sp.]